MCGWWRDCEAVNSWTRRGSRASGTQTLFLWSEAKFGQLKRPWSNQCHHQWWLIYAASYNRTRMTPTWTSRPWMWSDMNRCKSRFVFSDWPFFPSPSLISCHFQLKASDCCNHETSSFSAYKLNFLFHSSVSQNKLLLQKWWWNFRTRPSNPDLAPWQSSSLPRIEGTQEIWLHRSEFHE